MASNMTRLGFESWLRTFYAKHAPSKLDNVSKIAKKYKTRAQRQHLINFLERKYKEEPAIAQPTQYSHRKTLNITSSEGSASEDATPKRPRSKGNKCAFKLGSGTVDMAAFAAAFNSSYAALSTVACNSPSAGAGLSSSKENPLVSPMQLRLRAVRAALTKSRKLQASRSKRAREPSNGADDESPLSGERADKRKRTSAAGPSSAADVTSTGSAMLADTDAEEGQKARMEPGDRATAASEGHTEEAEDGDGAGKGSAGAAAKSAERLRAEGDTLDSACSYFGQYRGPKKFKLAAGARKNGAGAPFQLKCFNCGGVGHMRSACPKADKRVCLLCVQLGHTVDKCPERRCRLCSQRGHLAGGCRAGGKGVGPGERWRRRQQCSYCDSNQGHDAEACPQRTFDDALASLVVCVVCGETGHGSSCQLPCDEDAHMLADEGADDDDDDADAAAPGADGATSVGGCYNCASDAHGTNACTRPKEATLIRQHQAAARRAPPSSGGSRGGGGGGRYDKMVCYKCQKGGHIARHCPNQQPHSAIKLARAHSASAASGRRVHLFQRSQRRRGEEAPDSARSNGGSRPRRRDQDRERERPRSARPSSRGSRRPSSAGGGSSSRRTKSRSRLHR